MELSNYIWSCQKPDTILQTSTMDDQGFLSEFDDDVTYYNRQCTLEDITTTDSNDLIIPRNATNSQTAVDIMMEHGAIIMKDVLSTTTVSELREYLESRHDLEHELPYLEVLEVDNSERLSLNLGIGDHPVIGKALEEIGNNEEIKSILEGLLGSDPAIIELTSLTSFLGAKSQGK